MNKFDAIWTVINMKCYNCEYSGDKTSFVFDGTELVAGHTLEKYRCPKCGEIHWHEQDCGE